MIDLYYWTTPNGHKITIFLEEAGLDYRIHPVNIGAGDQFKPEFLKISPNNKIPAIVDHQPEDGGEPLALFESGEILLYLAEKTGRFLPQNLRSRGSPIRRSHHEGDGSLQYRAIRKLGSRLGRLLPHRRAGVSCVFAGSWTGADDSGTSRANCGEAD